MVKATYIPSDSHLQPSSLQTPTQSSEKDVPPHQREEHIIVDTKNGSEPSSEETSLRKRSRFNSQDPIDGDAPSKPGAVEDDPEIYGASRFGHFGEYMRRKRAKLQIQNANMDTGGDKTGVESGIFRGISVYINGWTKPSVQDLRLLIVKHGGVFQPYLDKKSLVTHIVTCSLTPAKIREFKHMKVVRPEWLVDSVAAGVLLPWTDYIFRPGNRVEPSQGSQVGQKILHQTAQPVASTSTSARRTEQQRRPDVHRSDNEKRGENSAGVVASNSATEEDLYMPIPDRSTSPRPLYMTDPTTYEEAARIPGYAAHTSNEMAERVMANPQWRAAHTSIAPDFIEGFYKNSRLHHLSMWKAELKNLVMEAQARAESGDGSEAAHDGGDTTLFSTTADAHSGEDVSMRSAEFVMRSPSKAKGKQKAEEYERVIMHCDFDCFFVSAGLVTRPHLRGKPVVVCHSQGGQGGASSTSEIASSSYEARAFGIKNGMSLRQARQLCPTVITIPYEFERYKSLSLQFYTILMRHADDLQAVSVDEALIDVSSAVARLCTSNPLSTDDFAFTLAETIRRQVKEATGCEVSIGIAENIQLARIATRCAKPAGAFHLKQEDVQKVLEPLDIDDLHGFGYSTRQKAKEKLGATKLGELAKKSKAALCEALGKTTGETLFKAIRGIDERKLESDKPRKSVSCDINYGIRFENNEQAKEFVYRMAEEVSRRLESVSMRGRSLTLKIMKRDPSAPKEAPKFMGHGICETFNKQTTLTNAQGCATSDSKDIGEHAWRLLESWDFDPTELRGIGIQIQKLEKSGDTGQAKLSFGHLVDNNPPKAVDTATSEVPEIMIQRPPSPQNDRTPAGQDKSATKQPAGVVDLPSFSQVDKDVFNALPEDVRMELEKEYQRRSKSPMPLKPVPVPVVVAKTNATANNTRLKRIAVKGANLKRITQQLAPRSRTSLSPRKSALFGNLKSTGLAAVRTSEDELRSLNIDPEVFSALPMAMQREQLITARHLKNGGQLTERKVIKDHKRRRIHYPKKPPPLAKHPQPAVLKQQGKTKGEKLCFTETDDVQRVIEAWVERFTEVPPNTRDVEYFSKFLVQSVETSDTGMEKTVTVMKWWLVLLRRNWGMYERVEAEDVVVTQRVTSERIAVVWWNAFRDVKAKVDAVARKRFGGSISLK